MTGSTSNPTRALFFASLLLHFASVWLMAIALHAMHLPEKALLLFGFLIMLPPYVAPAAYVLSENLTEFALCVSFAALTAGIRRDSAALLGIAGAAVAFSALVRPANLGLAFALAAAIWMVAAFARSPALRPRAVLRASVALILASVLVLGSYSVFNWARFGYFGVTPKLGFSLSTRTLRFLERLPAKDAPVREALIRARDASLIQRNSSHLGNQFIWGGVIDELESVTGMTRTELSKHMFRLNMSLIARAPLEYVLEVCRAMSGYWFPNTDDLANRGSRALQALWSVLEIGVLLLFASQLIVAAGVGLLAVSSRLLRRALRSGRGVAGATEILAYVLAGVIVFYTAAISCLVEVGDMRYRAPTEIFIVFLTVVGLSVWRRAVTLSTVTEIQHPGLALELRAKAV